jgi:hypothetical protein
MDFFSENEEHESIPVKKRVFHFKREDMVSPNSSLFGKYKKFKGNKDFFNDVERPKTPEEIMFLL